MIAHGVPRRRLILKNLISLETSRHTSCIWLLLSSIYLFKSSRTGKKFMFKKHLTKRATKSAPWYTPGSQAMKNQGLSCVFRNSVNQNQVVQQKSNWNFELSSAWFPNSLVPFSSRSGLYLRAGRISRILEALRIPRILWVSPLSLLTPWAIKSLESNLLVISNLFMGRFDKSIHSTPFCDYTIFFHFSIEKITVTSHQNGWLVWIRILAG